MRRVVTGVEQFNTRAVVQPGAWRAQGHWLRFGNQRIFVTICGQGPPVLLLHAFPTASYDYSRIVPLLAQHFRVYLCDFPGFGFSDKPRVYPYSLFTYADALQALATVYGLSRVFVLAHDIGASVALELLRRGTPLVERMVMLNTSVLPSPRTHPIVWIGHTLLRQPVIGTLFGRLRMLRRPLFARTFCPLFARGLTSDELDAFWSLVQFNDGRSIYPQLLTYIPERKIHQAAWMDALAAHPAPLTLIWGQADPIAVPAIAKGVLARRPDARYVPLQDIGHYPHWEAPEETAAAVIKAFSS